MAKEYSSPPAMVIDPAKNYTAVIETSAGSMTAEFFAADAPGGWAYATAHAMARAIRHNTFTQVETTATRSLIRPPCRR